MTTPATTPTTSTRLRIDFLFLDLETCTRCRGTDRNLESALESARELLTATGTEVEVNKVRVDSAELARELRFESSPTIRVNHRDVALELRESSCGSEACTDGCGESIACRVWVHAGEEYTEPPVAMIIDAILREVYGGAIVAPAPYAELYELPENLERFFAGTVLAETVQAPAQAECCSPAAQGSCCDPEDKAECCSTATGGSCGCR
jgi:hypothetical protein